MDEQDRLTDPMAPPRGDAAPIVTEPAAPPPPPALLTDEPPVAAWPRVQTSAPGGGGAGSAVGLWSAGEIGVVSFLFGFPAGLGLAARNWYRLGQRPMAYAHLGALCVGMVLLLLAPDALSRIALAANVAIAVYLYAHMRSTLRRAAGSGVPTRGGGAAAGIATAAGGWALALATAVLLGPALAIMDPGGDLVAGLSDASPAPTATVAAPAASTPSAGSVAAPTPSNGTATPGSSPGATPDLADCPDPFALTHQAPDLEAQLPGNVGGRDLSTWSVAGWCWLKMSFGEEALSELAPLLEEENVDVGNLRYAVAGRMDTAADPPYFVFAAYRPQAASEIDVALALLLQGAGYEGVTIDLSDFELHVFGDRMTFVGTPDMVTQSEHQRGRPWLYQTDDAMFLVVTDDDAWAEEAIRQLPCCWEGS